VDERKQMRRYQPRVGHRRKLLAVRLEPGLLYRLQLLADDKGVTLSTLIAASGERTVSEANQGAQNVKV
jgi:hypothetical protein